MTETIAPAQSLAEGAAAESPHIPQPETDGPALRAIEEATAHVRERALRPGRQREIQDCVDKILATVDPAAAGA